MYRQPESPYYSSYPQLIIWKENDILHGNEKYYLC